MDSFFGFFFTFTLQLFIIVDPLAGGPIFLAITPQNSRRERRAMALKGCLTAFSVLAFFILVGPSLLDYFGIRTPAVRIGGGILLFLIALEMLYGRPTGTGTSRREERMAEAKEDISITPLAIPLLAGPGAIATCLIFADRAKGLTALLALLLGLSAVMALTLAVLFQAHRMAAVIGTLGSAILIRIMGLVLVFLAVQYVVDGIGGIRWPG